VSRDLPARANLEHLKKQAKALLRDVRQQDPQAIRRVRAFVSKPESAAHNLADAQHVIAREHGFETWAALKEHVQTRVAIVDPFDALAAAVRADDVSRVDQLLRTHRELRLRLNDPIPGGDFGATALGPAVRRKNREMIDLLLRHGADVNARSHWWAGSFGALDLCDPELAPFLIERGARVDAHSAARLGMLDELDALVGANPGLVHARGGDGQTPLHFASTREIAQYLLTHGADIDARDVDHESTPAQYMVGDRQDIARLLVERGCRTDILMTAALGDIDRVRRHLEADPASIRMRVSDEYFPMRDSRAGGTIYIWTLGRAKTAHAVARAFGHDEIFRLLMQRSPDVLRLAQACMMGDEKVVDDLIATQPEITRDLSSDELAALVDAAETDDAKAVRLMLAAGWPVDARRSDGATALHFAAWLGNATLVRELIGRGAPLEAVENMFNGRPLGWAFHGSTNSWRASSGDYAGVVEALLSAGAQAPPLPDGLDVTDAVLEVLRRHGKR
jgi:ankyrin repeat protein